MAELSGYQSSFWLGTHGHDVGAMTPLFYMLREREEIMNLFELTAGGRLMPNYIRIGGLAEEEERPRRRFCKGFQAFTDHFDARVDKYHETSTRHYQTRFIWIGPRALAFCRSRG